MRFCYTVVFTSNYAQIPRPIISVNSSFLRGQFAKVVKLENFFEFLQNSWAVIRTCARQTEQPSNLITMAYIYIYLYKYIYTYIYIYMFYSSIF